MRISSMTQSPPHALKSDKIDGIGGSWNGRRKHGSSARLRRGEGAQQMKRGWEWWELRKGRDLRVGRREMLSGMPKLYRHRFLNFFFKAWRRRRDGGD